MMSVVVSRVYCEMTERSQRTRWRHSTASLKYITTTTATRRSTTAARLSKRRPY